MLHSISALGRVGCRTVVGQICGRIVGLTACRDKTRMNSNQNAGEHASTAFLLLLGAMSAFPPVTTDIYLPALPELTQSLGGTVTEGQITLAVYFVGLGFGQLFYGPWSDRIGRRPTMLTGAVIYLIASVGCAIATTMNEMI